MNQSTIPIRHSSGTRQKLMTATRELILHQGFSATGVDEICTQAGVTKGAFFHHFKTKEDIGLAAMADWAEFGMQLYAQAKAEPRRYPLDHVHRFFGIMLGFVNNLPPPLTCVVGIMAQELAAANPAVQRASSGYLGIWTEFARQLLEEAKAAQKPEVDFDSTKVAWMLNCLWQGSMLIAKARQEPEIIRQNLESARDYVDGLFSSDSVPSKPHRGKRSPQRTKPPIPI